MSSDRTNPPQPTQPIDPEPYIRQLSEMLDLIEYQDFIGRKTRYGRKPGPGPWHYTRKLVSTYNDPPDVEDVIRHFESAGCKDEVAASKWIVINDELLP